MRLAAHPRSRRLSAGTLAALALTLLCVSQPAAAGARASAALPDLLTAVDTTPDHATDGVLEMSRVRDAGARIIRLDVAWTDVAPATRPAGFDPANPDSPGYDWREMDREVIAAAGAGLAPLINLQRTPAWAVSPFGGDAGTQQPRPGFASPDPAQFGLFAAAAARRYDGTHLGLPHIRYWAVWNEPNWSAFLAPQLVGGKLVAVDRYREMVNAFADGVHGVDASNVVVAGELFPNALRRGNLVSVAPLAFTRQILCLSPGARPHRTCATQLKADVWSVHPYTSGGPSTLPADPDGVWIANLSALSSLVRSAQAQGTLVSSHTVATWVTEFSWNTNPPRGGGVPVALAQRWVAETLYKAWRAGIGLFAWFQLRDDQLNASLFQAGLYYGCATGPACDQPKPILTSFRFPFVAYLAPGRRVTVWGRTPPGVAGPVRVQVRRGGRWVTLATLRPTAGGVFSALLRLAPRVNARSAMLRAQATGAGSAPFSLKRPKDILVKPFV